MRFIFFALVALASSAAAQSSRDIKVDGSQGYNQDRISSFPTGSGKLFLTVVTGDNWQTDARTKQVASWFRTDARLQHARSNTWWNWYLTSNPHFKERLRVRLGDAVPIVALQKPDGQVILNVTAKSMPTSAGALADMIDDALQAHYAPPQMGHVFGYETPIEEEDCPDCNPDDPDEPDPPLDVIDEVLPPSKKTGFGIWAVGLGLLLGVGAVAALVVTTIVARQPRPEPRSQFPTF